MTDQSQIEDKYRLLPMQHAMLFHTLSAPGSGCYIGQVISKLASSTDLPAFERAWREVMRRHGILRTSFYCEGSNEPEQHVHTEVPFHMQYRDVRHLEPEAAEAELKDYLEKDREQGFDLNAAPLMRFALFHLQSGEWWFVWTHHHALLDGRGRVIVLKEVATLYSDFHEGQEPQLPAPPVYKDYVEWFYRLDQKGAREYWKSLLADFSPPLSLSEMLTSDQLAAKERYASRRINLSSSSRYALNNVVREKKVTWNILLQALWCAVLNRYIGARDIVFGETRACRRPAFQGAGSLVGLVINTVPVRLKVDPDTPFVNLVEILKLQHIGSRAYENMPLPEIRACAGIAGHENLFETIVVIEEHELESVLRRDGALLWSGRIYRSSPTHYPLALVGFIKPEPTFEIAYDTALFAAPFVKRFTNDLERLMEAVAHNPSLQLGETPLLGSSEQLQLMQWGRAESGYSRGQCIADLFEKVADDTPAAIALIFRDQELSYKQLNAEANQLAHHLQALGVKPEVRVGLCVERSKELIVSLLAIVKAGGVCVPLDRSYPAGRLAYMVTDSSIQVLIASRELADQLSFQEGVIVDLAEEWANIAAQATDNLGSASEPANLSYLIYTSGSTGLPKGVGIAQDSIVRLVMHADYAPLDKSQIILQLAPVSFDASFFEIWGSLLNGARLVIMPPGIPSVEEIGDTIQRYKITTLWLTSGLFHQMVEYELQSLRCVKQLLAGGDVLSGPHVEKYLEELDHGSCLINGYGPTENTTFTCCYRMTRGWRAARSVPVGHPISGTRVYVLDESMQLAPRGAVGSLYVGGRGMARGYTDAALTAERFVPDSISGEAGARLYRTGDRVRWREDGSLEFLGRKDNQIKIRGYRIELGEIEAALRACEGVSDAAVLAQPHREGKRLVGFVAGRDKAGINAARLHQELEKQLPSYMIPRLFVTLEHLPLTLNGKIDRAKLETIVLEPEEQNGLLAAPRTPIEELLAGIWADVLKLETISTDADVFERGAHSLLAMQVRSRIQRSLRVDVSVQHLLQCPTIAAQAEHIEKELQAGKQCHVAAIRRPEKREHAPLSFAQQGLWFLYELAPSATHYNIPLVLQLSGPLNVGSLERAIEEIVRRHEILRTTFKAVDGVAMQIVHGPERWTMEHVDLSDLPDSGRQLEVERQVIALARRPFNLKADIPLRTTLLRSGLELNTLVLIMHHLAGDGWSANIFLREMAVLYQSFNASQPSPLSPMELQYTDYALWERQWLEPSILDEHLEYWKRQLANAPSIVELPIQNSRATEQRYAGAKLRFSVTEELSRRLRQLCRSEGCTLHMLLTAAFAVLLYRYSGQEDILIGTPAAGRDLAETQGLIGLFVNTLVLRNDLSGAPRFCDFLQRVRQTALDAHAHHELPFEKLVKELRPKREAAHEPLVQMVIVQDTLPDEWSMDNTSVRVETPDTGTAKFDLTLSFMESRQELRASLEFNIDLFEAEAIRRFANHYQALLNAIVAEPREELLRLSMLSQAEREEMASWAGARVTIERGQCLHELFEQQALRTPSSLAVVCGQQRLTYAELDQKANQLAHYLKKEGVGPEVMVGICLERSLEMVVAVLGVLKAGGAYVPLDARQPVERLRFMVEDSAVQILLTEESLAGPLPKDRVRTTLLDKEWNKIAVQNNSCPRSQITPDSSAYVIYTSGSTGRPKGVVVTHYNVQRLLQATNDYFGFDGTDVWTLFHSLAFDFSVWEIWGALAHGGRLVVVPYHVSRSPEEFYKLVEAEGVTVLNQTPSAFEQFLEQDTQEAKSLQLRYVIFGGEALVLKHLAPWLVRHEKSGPKMLNMYGITETTVHVTLCELRTEDALHDASPVGKAIRDLEVYVLDDSMGLVPAGIAGEIYVGGAGLARGYLNRPDLTAERFVPNPFSGRMGERLYRTGDRARLSISGTLEYLGRADHQVKIRGFRIELREIEAVLESCPGVKQAVVLLQGTKTEEKRLLAYVVPIQPSQRIESKELKKHLQKYLPDYMVPAAFTILETLPLTANGKVDRHALLALEHNRSPEEEHEPPSNPTERLIAKIWSAVLSEPALGRNANFFDAGGHSLLALRVTSRVRAAFGVRVPLRTLFDYPILSEFASQVEFLSQCMEKTRSESIGRVARADSLPLSFNQEGRLLREWLERMQNSQSQPFHIVCGLRLTGNLDVNALEETISQIVHRQEVLRTGFELCNGQDSGELLSLFQFGRQNGGLQAAIQNSSNIASRYFRLFIAPYAAPNMQRIDFSGLSGREQDVEISKVVESESRMPFDYAKPPLLRTVLIKTGDRDHLLIVTLHHMISDRWSVEVFQNDLALLYSAGSTDRELAGELPAQYIDFAAWQRKQLQGEKLEKLAAYWRNQWLEFPLFDVRELPFISAVEAEPHVSTGMEQVTWDAVIAGKLHDFVKERQLTLFILFLAALNILLHLYTGKRRIGIWGHFANRPGIETENVIGWFANNHLLGARLDPEDLIDRFTEHVRDLVLEADAHQEIPFPLLWVTALSDLKHAYPAERMQTAPHVAFDFSVLPVHSTASQELAIEPVALPGQGLQLALYLSASQRADQIILTAHHVKPRLSSITVRRLLHDWQKIVEAMVMAPTLRISALAGVIKAAEYQSAMDVHQEEEFSRSASTGTD